MRKLHRLLTHKYGPLKLSGWLLAGAGTLGVIWYRKRHLQQQGQPTDGQPYQPYQSPAAPPDLYYEPGGSLPQNTGGSTDSSGNSDLSGLLAILAGLINGSNSGGNGGGGNGGGGNGGGGNGGGGGKGGKHKPKPHKPPKHFHQPPHHKPGHPVHKTPRSKTHVTSGSHRGQHNPAPKGGNRTTTNQNRQAKGRSHTTGRQVHGASRGRTVTQRPVASHQPAHRGR